MLFEYDLTTNAYSVKHNISLGDGHGFSGRLTLFNNKFYGLMNEYGIASGTGLGTLFEYDPTTSVFSKKYDFQTEPVGFRPFGSLTVLNNKLYGLNAVGVLFEYDPITNAIAARHTFTSAGGAAYSPVGSLVAFRGKLYGQTRAGGPNGLGEVFSFDPAVSGTAAYSPVAPFSAATGYYDASPAAYEGTTQLVVFPDCQLSAMATVASTSLCVNDAVGLAVSVKGQNCQPSFSWTADSFSRLTSPANTSAVSATALLAGTRSFSVTVTESLCSVSATTSPTASDMFSVRDGNWNDPATWSCGRVPFAPDIVNIRHAVTLPPSYTANALRLRFDTAKQLIYGLQARMRLGLP